MSISWRKFKVLLFSLVSQESSFYAPYHQEMYEEMKRKNDRESDFTKNKQKTVTARPGSKKRKTKKTLPKNVQFLDSFSFSVKKVENGRNTLP